MGVAKHEEKKIYEQMIVALDINDWETLEKWAELLKSHVKWVKVGMELFYAHGLKVVSFLQEKGFSIFLDLKLHDIPNTVQKAARILAEMGVDIFNLHTLGGFEMMKRTAEVVKNTAVSKGRNCPKVIGVTILTSHNETVLKEELRINSRMKEEVLHLAVLAKNAGLDGVVCSPQEIKIIKNQCGKEFLTVVPGIRPAWSSPGDQVRILTPGQAIKDGADYIVIGRPILNAPDPVAAINRIVEEMTI